MHTNTELEFLLKLHTTQYPLMTAQDAVKLLYQQEFGCGHMIADEASSLSYLKEEYAATFLRSGVPLSEPIGNGYIRLNLCAMDAQLFPLTMLNHLFVQTAAHGKGSLANFKNTLQVLLELTEKGEFPFSLEDLQNYLTDYAKQGYPAVSHSQIYRDAYHPAYRVLLEEQLPLFTIIPALAPLLTERTTPLVIAIDGNCASGKSTLAAHLAKCYSASVIHMDDFFLPYALRTPERLQEPGGNVHYERFAKEVISHLHSGDSFAYSVFDCSIGDYNGQQTVAPSQLIIVEGAYSLHPFFHNPYDFTIFLSSSPEVQKTRILARNGETMYENFRTKWIPMEQHYFDTFQIAKQCHLRLSTSGSLIS